MCTGGLSPNTQVFDAKAAPSVEAHHRSVGPDAGRNSGGRQIKIWVYFFASALRDFFSF